VGEERSSWPVVGDVVEIPEPDYCYGVGTLVMRVTAIRDSPARPGWAYLRGVQLADDGSEVKEREVLARLAAVRRLN